MSFDSDAPTFYEDTAKRLAAALNQLTDQEWQTAVTACPGWSVGDVVAHISGLVAETLAGVPLPRGSDEATARQVADRSMMTPQDVVREWRSNAADFAEYGEIDPAYVAALTSDLVVHAHDIAEAVGSEIELGSAVVVEVACRYGELLQQRCAAALPDTALSIEFVSGPTLEPVVTGTPSDLRLVITAHDFLRSITGRRSRAHVEQLEWSADPTAILEHAWSQYGPLAD